jgi:hypothetical protein
MAGRSDGQEEGRSFLQTKERRVSTSTLKHGTGTVAEKVADKTVDVATEIAERAKKQAEMLAQVAESAAERLPGRKAKPKHRARKVFGALIALGAAAFAATKGRRALQQRREQQQVIDLTLGPKSAEGRATAVSSSTTTGSTSGAAKGSTGTSTTP